MNGTGAALKRGKGGDLELVIYRGDKGEGAAGNQSMTAGQ